MEPESLVVTADCETLFAYITDLEQRLAQAEKEVDEFRKLTPCQMPERGWVMEVPCDWYMDVAAAQAEWEGKC